ncbi:MAG: gliding motility-associated C-terminal domain-containing protein [Flavobacteriales bacterium]
MNLRHAILLLFVSLGFGQMQAQTALQIVNGGFESYSTLPSGMGQWNLTYQWGNAGSATAAPDYYHYLSGPASDIPETPMAIVDASDGDAIMGLALSGKDLTNSREYLSTHLLTPMIPGQQYLIGFKLTNGSKTETSYSGLAVSDIGLLFSTAPINQVDFNPIVANPQLKIDTVFYNREWTAINFVYTADQPYEYMTFGVFRDDSNVSIETREGTDPLFAYYFVDEFYLEPTPDDYEPIQQDHDKDDHNDEPSNGGDTSSDIPSPDPFFIPNSFSPNNDGNNDIFIPVSNTLKEWEFSIYSVWGERVFITEDETKGWDGKFWGQDAPNGNYVWKISYTIWNDVTGLHTINKNGIVVLLR